MWDPQVSLHQSSPANLHPIPLPSVRSVGESWKRSSLCPSSACIPSVPSMGAHSLPTKVRSPPLSFTYLDISHTRITCVPSTGHLYGILQPYLLSGIPTVIVVKFYFSFPPAPHILPSLSNYVLIQPTDDSIHASHLLRRLSHPATTTQGPRQSSVPSPPYSVTFLYTSTTVTWSIYL